MMVVLRRETRGQLKGHGYNTLLRSFAGTSLTVSSIYWIGKHYQQFSPLRLHIVGVTDGIGGSSLKHHLCIISVDFRQNSLSFSSFTSVKIGHALIQQAIKMRTSSVANGAGSGLINHFPQDESGL